MQETSPGRRRMPRIAAGVLAVLAAPLPLFLPMLVVDDPATLEDGSLRSLCLLVMGSSLALAVLAAGLGALSRVSLRRALGWVPTAPGLGAGDAALLVAGTVAFSHCIDLAIQGSGLRDDSVLEHIDRAVAGAAGGELWLAMLAVAALPAVAEETLFRGVLFGRLRPRVGLLAAALLSSAAFGLVHADAAQGLGATLLGLYLAAVTARSDGIGLPIACHFANNATALVGAAWGLTAGRLGAGIWIAGSVAAAALAVLALQRLRRLGAAP